MSFEVPMILVRLGSAKVLTRSSRSGSLPELDNPMELWL